MKTFAVLLSSALVLGSATPIANYWLSPVAISSQYHTQEPSGSYRYGYTGPHHAKMETRSNGVTQGGYSYVDANGILQTVAYSADAVKGFRVRASNLPHQPESPYASYIETPEVAAERKREEFVGIAGNADATNIPRVSPHIFPTEQSMTSQESNTPMSSSQVIARDAKNPFLLSLQEASRIEIPRPDFTPTNLINDRRDVNSRNEENHGNYQSLEAATSVVPLPSVHGNIVAPSSAYALPVLPYGLLHSSLRHTQDSLGQYDYSYVGDTSSKTESRSLDGTTRGAYSYVDANGLLQQVHYIADHNGFRVLATNLPEA